MDQVNEWLVYKIILWRIVRLQEKAGVVDNNKKIGFIALKVNKKWNT